MAINPIVALAHIHNFYSLNKSISKSNFFPNLIAEILSNSLKILFKNTGRKKLRIVLIIYVTNTRCDARREGMSSFQNMELNSFF